MRHSPHGRLSAARRPTTVALALTLVLIASALTPTTASAAGGPAGDVFAQTNAQRYQAGLPALVSDPALDAAAAEWARHLASSCTFAHSSSTWRSARVAASGWIATGENIAAGQANATEVMTSWMNSPGHKANILDKRYTGLGVGYATGTCYRTYWVQIFGIGTPRKSFPAGAGDLTSDRFADVLARSSTGDLMVYPGTGVGSFRAPGVALSGWGDRPFTTLGDFTGDGIPDIARTEADGRLMLYAGNGSGGFRAPTQIGKGWGGFTQLIGGIDFNGDRSTDIIARRPNGELALYRGNGRGGFIAGNTTIGRGWQSMTAVFYAGDFNGDARGDIVARKADGTLWLYPTTGKGTWGKAIRIGTGWRSMTALFGAGDLDGNGTQDIVARGADGTLYLYGGNGRGGFLAKRTIGGGWNIMRQIG
ncbi:VCBS repeat-containing protein [Microbacterium sp. SSW1-49]|uniref:VCBS repeat-containing protein n=1 Tax=Microbacterium croceum TaxID=2851645 RepID=A0ABT0FHY3_9MICO|nr:FG-GAP-like repeat-containing protein [Microbacterium croceum]MCK2037352.1 VCBS repeat-containing protein [Microbacterium croceum]